MHQSFLTVELVFFLMLLLKWFSTAYSDKLRPQIRVNMSLKVSPKIAEATDYFLCDRNDYHIMVYSIIRITMSLLNSSSTKNYYVIVHHLGLSQRKHLLLFSSCFSLYFYV